jgi:hypothetical protein
VASWSGGSFLADKTISPRYLRIVFINICCFARLVFLFLFFF